LATVSPASLFRTTTRCACLLAWMRACTYLLYACMLLHFRQCHAFIVSATLNISYNHHRIVAGSAARCLCRQRLPHWFWGMQGCSTTTRHPLMCACNTEIQGRIHYPYYVYVDKVKCKCIHTLNAYVHSSS
jgi:hypothetical protein